MTETHGPMTPLDLHRYAAEMRERANMLAGVAADRSFSAGDARDSFHNNASNAILNHCIALGMFHAARGYPLTKRNRDATVLDVVNLLSIGSLQSFYFSKLRAQLFLEIWFAFEDWLRVLYKSDGGHRA